MLLITFSDDINAESRKLYDYVLRCIAKEHFTVFGKYYSDATIKINLQLGDPNPKQLACANIDGFTSFVLNNPSSMQLTSIAGMLAHEFAHWILERHFSSFDIMDSHRLSWNLVHYAVYADQSYLNTRRMLGATIYYHMILRIAFVDVARLIEEKDAVLAKLPMIDGQYFV